MNPFQKDLWTKPSAIGLLVANIVPLLGVLFLGWSTFAVVALYWAENVVIGLINILRIICCMPASTEEQEALSAEGPVTPMAVMRQAMAKQSSENPSAVHLSKIFLIPFFTVHYGLFCLVHGVFIFALLGEDSPFLNGPNAGSDPFSIQAAFDRFSADQLWWGVAALGISHLVSFFTNYIGGGEYRRTVPPVLMFQPYARIVVLHIAILFGAFATIALGSPVFILVLLIVGKTILDLALHTLEHRKTFSQ